MKRVIPIKRSVLSYPSKMPCPAFNLPARACITGAQLHEVEGSVCAGCYALKGRYNFGNVQRAMDWRLTLITQPNWVELMVAEIAATGTEYFRWHDSGDLQSVEHLERIAEIARRLPKVKFWLPTREKAIVLRWGKQAPPNLTIRVSAAMVDGAPPKGFHNTSTVVTSGANCPATTVRHTCDDCRRCWDRRVRNVAYKEH